MKTKILIVEGQRNIGGGQVMTRKIASILNEQYLVSIFLPDGKSEVSDYLSGFPQYGYPMHGYTRGRKTMKDIARFAFNFHQAHKALKKCVLENDISLIYVQAPALLPVAALVGNQTGRDVIAHLHVVHSDHKSLWLINHFLGYKSVRKIIGVSGYTLTQLAKSNRKKSAILYNCVDFNPLQKPKQLTTGNNISIIADVLPDKGQHIVIEALDNYSQNTPELNIIGKIVNTQYREKLDNGFAKPNFAGQVTNVKEWIDHSSLVLIPSFVYETFSLSMVEAWAQGVPTIASDIGGMKELVEKFLPQYAGHMLFELGSSRNLAIKIDQLLNDKKLYDEISAKAIEVVRDNFTIDIYRKELVKIINSLTT